MPRTPTRDQRVMARAAELLPAGGLGNFDPGIMIESGHGAYVAAVDGTRYLDYLIGSGPMILGHGHPEVLEAVQHRLHRGTTFFANNPAAVELAEVIIEAVPCAEQLRYVTCGGEADMYAIRVARAATGRDKILKFEGGYHGMSAEAQMSLAPRRAVDFPAAVPDSAGIPRGVAEQVLVAPFNDAAFVEALVAEHGACLAAVIVEPMQRLIPPAPGFLAALRRLCDTHGMVLIFDEVVTGFRLDYGAAQTRYGVTPDLTTLGKIIGGGFPLAAIVGRRDLMAHFDRGKVGEDGFLMQLGTLSGHPVAAVAGLKTLEILRRPGNYEKLRAQGNALMEMIDTTLSAAGIPHRLLGDPTLFDVVFTHEPVANYRDMNRHNAAHGALFNKVLRAHGILKSPGKFYVHLAIGREQLAETERAVQRATEALVEHG